MLRGIVWAGKGAAGQLPRNRKNKGFTLINNGASGCGINFSLGGDMLTHMLNHAQRMEVGAFILKRQADAWDMSVSDVLALLRQSVTIKRA